MPPTDEWIYGRHPVLETLRAGRRQIGNILIASGTSGGEALEAIEAAAEAHSVAVERVPRSRLDRIHPNHQGVAAQASAYPYVEVPNIVDEALKIGSPPLFLLLDMLQDPQNLGTLLRTAEAVGVHGVILPHRRAAGVTPAVVSASAGASEFLDIARANLAQSIQRLKAADVWIVGMENSADALPLAEVDLRGGIALVVGSEAAGLRRLVRESCDYLVRLPMLGRIDSLNAAVAGSIALYSILQARGPQERPPADT